jgi:hypothetical protein
MSQTPTILEYLRSDYNTTDNWVSLANLNLSSFSSGFSDTQRLTLDELSNTTANTWTGNTSTDWVTRQNWSKNIVPDASSDLTIPDKATTTYSPLVNAASTVHNLTIESSGLLTIGTTGQLTVSNTLTNSQGASGLVIKSTSSGTGSLIESSAGVSATVERYIQNNNYWHFLSSPVSNQDIWPEFAPSPSGVSFGAGPCYRDFYYWNPNANTTLQKYRVNLRKDATGVYNNQTVDAIGDLAGFGPEIPEMTVGRGYLAAYTTNWYPATNSPETHIFTGTLNTGTVTRAITYQSNNQFNLTGNSYPSAIDWKASGWDRSPLVVNSGGYDYWIYNNITGNYGVFNSNGSVGTHGTSQYIAPMQGFFVLAASSGTMEMTQAVRAHSSQSWIKEADEANDYLKLQVTSSATSYLDEMIVAVNRDYENGGSMKFWSMAADAPELYSMKSGSNYSIDRMPFLDEQTTVTIGIKPGSLSPVCKLEIPGADKFGYAKDIVLEDLKTGATQMVKLNPVYTFTIAEGDSPERFHLHFVGPFGISGQKPVPDFNIYAFNKTVFIRNISGKTCTGKVLITNLLGQTVVHKPLMEHETRIEVSGATGCYVVTVVTPCQVFSRKVFIR